MFHDWGNHPINSTFALASNPSTSTLIAELDSTQLGTQNLAPNQKLLMRVNWILGSDTNAIWQIESASSTGLGNVVDAVFPMTPAKASGQFVTYHEMFANYRLRARVQSTFSGTAAAYITAEKLT